MGTVSKYTISTAGRVKSEIQVAKTDVQIRYIQGESQISVRYDKYTDSEPEINNKRQRSNHIKIASKSRPANEHTNERENPGREITQTWAQREKEIIHTTHSSTSSHSSFPYHHHHLFYRYHHHCQTSSPPSSLFSSSVASQSHWPPQSTPYSSSPQTP